MSAPERALQNLNLDVEEMPVTRSNARLSRGGRGRDRAPAGSIRMDPLSRPSPRAPSSHPPESSRHGLRGSQRPGPSMPPRANRVTRVTNHGTSIEFQLRTAPIQSGVTASASQGSVAQSQPGSAGSAPEQVIVRIHYDTVRGDHRATCTCRAPNPRCFHIFWLIDRLNRELLVPSVIDASTMSARIGELYPRILDTSEASLPRLINYSTDSDPDEGEEIKVQDQHARTSELIWPSARTTRREQNQQYALCDVLSSFDKYRTPEELHHEAVDKSQVMTSQINTIVEDDLHATLYRLAMRDRHINDTLQNLVSSEDRTIKYYETQWSRVEGALHDTSITVAGCGTILRNIVHQVYEDRPVRLQQHPQGIQDRLGATLADFLVRLVRRLVDERNKDGSHHVVGRQSASAHEPAEERNIYAYLISDHPEPNPRMPERLTNLFVVGRFRDLDVSQWSHTRGQWDDIRADIRSAAAVTADEREYADKVQEMLFVINGTNDPSEFATLHRMPRYHQADD